MYQTSPTGTLVRPRVEIVLHVLNEHAVLERSVATLVAHLERHGPYPWRITIADNGSTDGTWEIACRLTATYPPDQSLRLDQRGRGRALRAAWLGSNADIVAYMDIDLSTGLEAFLPLIESLVSGERQVAIGSRLLPDAVVTRG